jgi:hypothetical protein
MQILRMIEEKRITPDEGVELLEALSAGKEGGLAQFAATGEEVAAMPLSPAETPVAESEWSEEPAAPTVPADMPNFRHVWLIPLAAGGVVSAVGLGSILLIQWASPGSLFLLCGWTPFLAGLAIVLLAFWSRTARWLHVRIRGERRITLSFPLPLRLAGWILRLVRPYVPQLEKTGLDEVILSLDEGLASEGGFYVDVQDGEAGEQVQVYIG